MYPRGGYPSYLVAASNAPALVRARANLTCTGTNDDQAIQALIDGLPAAPALTRGGQSFSGGKMGFIQLSEGTFNFSGKLTVPAGSVFGMRGMGVSSWIPIDTLSSTYEGGTLIYSTEANGEVFEAPKNGSGYPGTRLHLANFEIRVLNPTTNVTGETVNADGMCSGIIEDINILVDRHVTSTSHISTGLSLNAGANSDRKIVRGVHAFGYRVNGMLFNTTHLLAQQIVAGAMGNDTFSTCISIVGNQDNVFDGLHCFSGIWGVAITSGSDVAVRIGSIHFESVVSAKTMRIDSAKGVFIDYVNLDTGTTLSGDLADNSKCNLFKGALADNDTKRAQARGSATITSGNTSVSVTHNLIGTPTRVHVTPQDTNGSGFWVSSKGATTFDINIPSSVGSDAVFDWQAEV